MRIVTLSDKGDLLLPCNNILFFTYQNLSLKVQERHDGCLYVEPVQCIGVVRVDLYPVSMDGVS